MLVTKNEKWNSSPSRATRPSAMTMDITASRTGTRAAASVPNTSTRMISAKMMPMLSPRLRSPSEMVLESWPTVDSPNDRTRNPSGCEPWIVTFSRRSMLSDASSSDPAIDTGISVSCRSFDTSSGEWLW